MVKRSLLALLVGVSLLVIAGCGSTGSISDPNPNKLTQAQVQLYTPEVFAQLGSAVTVAIKNAGATCTASPCAVSYTYSCPTSGSIAVVGSLTGKHQTVTGGTLTETPSSCSDNNLVLNGKPNIEISNPTGTDDGTSTSGTVTANGDFSFAPAQSGTTMSDRKLRNFESKHHRRYNRCHEYSAPVP